MSPAGSVVGLDVGTSAVKAVRFDHAWRAVDSEAEATVVVRRPDGGREQDMDEVWAAATRVVSAVVARCDGPVDLLAVTAQGDGCWLVDAAGAPVGPALLWNDNRAAGIVEGWAGDGTLDRAFEITGSLGAPGGPHAQLRWLRAHDPDRVSRAAHLLSCGGWIHSRLTGRRVVDASDAANPFCDVATGAYDDRLLSLFDLQEEQRLLPPVVDGPGRVAPLGAAVARDLGLPSGTPVVLAPYDVVATAIGSGAVAVGEAFAVLGTTLCVGTVDSSPCLDRPAGGMTLPLGAPGRWLVAYATMTGTETLDWAARLLDLPDVAALGALAATSTRDDVPLLLPYLSPAGERAPFLDPHVRGSLHGVDLGHTRADLARAVLEGLSLAVLDCLEASGRPRSVVLSGGGARSALWSQLVSDATGVPVVRPDTPEVGARGAVLVGAVATERFRDLPEAVAATLVPGPVLEPDPARTDYFAARYCDLLARRGTSTNH